MTGPAAVLHDRRSPTPGSSVPGVLARPLSEPIAALLREGDTHGRYFSRSEAVMATALAAASAGWTETVWRDDRVGQQHTETGVEVARRQAFLPERDDVVVGEQGQAAELARPARSALS